MAAIILQHVHGHLAALLGGHTGHGKVRYMHEMLGPFRPGCWMLMLRVENICGEILLCLGWAWYLQAYVTTVFTLDLVVVTLNETQ